MCVLVDLAQNIACKPSVTFTLKHLEQGTQISVTADGNVPLTGVKLLNRQADSGLVSVM